MAIIFRNEKKIEQMIFDYFNRVEECMAAFEKGMCAHLTDGAGECMDGIDPTHALESKADDLRRDIEMLLYGQALLPESRGDILGMLETYDTVPNAAETVLAILETERIVVPELFKPDFRALLECNIQAYRLLRKTAEALFSNPKQTGYVQKEVDIKESESDRIERRLITSIFDSDLEKADKILLKDVVVAMGNISDRCENASDRIGIIAIKRRI